MSQSWIGQRYTYEEWPDERVIDGHLIKTPPKPPKTKVVNYGLKKENQKFRIPDQKMVWTIDAKLKDLDKEGNLIDPLTKEETEFIEQQWEYRRNGMWFFNNGYLEYITGEHWFYLSYYKIPTIREKKMPGGQVIEERDFGLPKFLDSDRDENLVWQEIVKDTRCLGMVEINRRRSGKTAKALSKCYNHATSNHQSNVAIQSKNWDDAKDLTTRIVEAWNEMPEYFRPIDAGYTQPQSGINFRAPSKFTRRKMKRVKALNSWIKPFPSNATRLDGKGIARVYQDEVFKTTEVDVMKRWGIVKPTLLVGTSVVGKAMLTSTVEEMSSESLATSKKLWDKSKLSTTNIVSGMTETGLKTLFIPANYGYLGKHPQTKEPFVDDYGYSRHKEAREYILAERQGLEGDDYWDWCRKFALTEEEAFRSTVRDSIFILERVFDQIDYNLTLPEGHVRTGTFVGNVHDGFTFRDSEKGPFKISYVPDERKRNLTVFRNGKQAPGNDKLGCFGCDPYDHSGTSDHRYSKGALHGIDRIDPMHPFRSGGVFLEYVYRQPNVGLFINDVVSACVFYGRKVLIENQKQVLIKAMEDMGLQKYMVYTDDSEFTKTMNPRLKPGISTSGKLVRERMMAELAEYISYFVGKIDASTQIEQFGISETDIVDGVFGRFPFDKTLKQLTEFDPNDWEKFDAVVSLMLAVMEMNRKDAKFKRHAERSTSNESKLKSIFRGMDISGSQSQIIR